MSARVFHQVVYVIQITSLTLLLCLNLLCRHEKHITVLQAHLWQSSRMRLELNITMT